MSVLKRKPPISDLNRKYSSEDNQLSSTRTSPSGAIDVATEQPDERLSRAPPSTRVCKEDCHRRNQDLKSRRFCVRKRSPGSPKTLRCARAASLLGDQCHNVDDSEIERRVNVLFYEIEHSLTDSVDETKIRSEEFEQMPAKVDMQTQTLM